MKIKYQQHLAVAFGIMLSLPIPHANAQAGSASEVFRQLAQENWVSRDISFRELGFNGPLVLGSPDNRREVYLPVPAGVPMSAGTIQFNANYIRANGGRTSMVLSLDGYPVMAKSFTDEKGDTSTAIGVDGAARANGFVRLGLNWTTAIAVESPCADSRTPGNILRIEPDTRFSYRFDGARVTDLKTAWGALPVAPVTLVAGNAMAKESYDTAWRIGVTVERMSRQNRIVAMPTVGKSFELGKITIPPGLKFIPAFAALAGGGNHVVKSEAEAGAILALGGQSPLQADIIVADKMLVGAMTNAFDALKEQIRQSDPDALPSFEQWKTRAIAQIAAPLSSGEVRVANVMGKPVIIVAPDAGQKLSGLAGDLWKQVALSGDMTIETVKTIHGDPAAISLKSLGGVPGSFDVLARGDWSANFDLTSVTKNGKLPDEIVMDVSAAPSPASTPPIASVFLNDVLLASRNLDANGQRERITASVPRYALGPVNVLKVTFVRQLVSDRCREAPEAFPVSVLPTSHITLKKGKPDDNFSGMMSRYSNGAAVMVPERYLADAEATLPILTRIAASTGISPGTATFSTVADGGKLESKGPFLALDVPINETKTKLNTEGSRSILTNASGDVIFSLSGIDRVGLLEVAKVSGEHGIVYRTMGTQAPALQKAFYLGRGNVAAVGAEGVLAEVDTEDASGRDLIDEGTELLSLRTLWTGGAILAIALFIGLLWAASRARRRATDGNDKH